MDTLFKEVSHINDAIRGYELKNVLESNGYDKMIPGMFISLDPKTVSSCWTSILYELPLTIVMIGDKGDKDKVILDNLCEIDSLMTIYGYNPRGEMLYVDPRSCELYLENSGEDFVPVNDVCDTFKMLAVIEDVRKSKLISDKDKELITDNLKHINTKLQRFEITLRVLQVRSYERSRLTFIMEQFYKELHKV